MTHTCASDDAMDASHSLRPCIKKGTETPCHGEKTLTSFLGKSKMVYAD